MDRMDTTAVALEGISAAQQSHTHTEKKYEFVQLSREEYAKLYESYLREHDRLATDEEEKELQSRYSGWSADV